VHFYSNASANSSNEPIRWQPNSCDLDTDWSPQAIASKLGAGHVVFIGDSTLEEVFMMVIEGIQRGSFQHDRNIRLHLTGANKNVTFNKETWLRVFDFARGPLRLRFLWGPHPLPFSWPDYAIGLATFNDSRFQEQLDAFLTMDNDTVKACVYAGCTRPLIVFNAGLHEFVVNDWTFDLYERRLGYVLRNLTARGLRVVVLATSPKFQNFACSSCIEVLGTPGVRAINEIARRASHATAGVTYLDVDTLRMSAPNDGDGHHCVYKYMDFENADARKFGVSCLWRMRTLVTTLSKLLHT